MKVNACCPMKSCRRPKKKTRKVSRRIRKCQPMKKCYRAGKVVRNSFFNFLRSYRRKHCGLTIVQIAKQGANVWNRMSDSDKCKYQQAAYCAKPYKRKRLGSSRSLCRSRSRSRSQCPKRSSSRKRSRRRC